MDKKHTTSNGGSTFDQASVPSSPTERDNFSFSLAEDTVSMNKLEKVIKKRQKRRLNKWTLMITFGALILIIVFITVAFLVAKGMLVKPKQEVQMTCSKQDRCRMVLVETLPPVLTYSTNQTISSHWLHLINTARTNIDILSFYWTLEDDDVPGEHEQAKVGKEVMDALRKAAGRGVKIRIVQTSPTSKFKQKDTADLAKASKNVQVRSLDMQKLIGAGIVHTKMFNVDGRHSYVGSANFDWRALTEVKELGMVLYDCACSSWDLGKIFESNWLVAEKGAKIPQPWPEQYQTEYNRGNPMQASVNDVPTKLYWTASPPQLCPRGRDTDISAILNLINSAQSFIYIAVMDYQPAIIYSHPRKFWPVIDDALRRAAYERKVDVCLLSSYWKHTSSDQTNFLKSLNNFPANITVKMFEMPDLASIQFSRVNHNKYMLTESSGLVSTSNWSGDYFEGTGGVSLVFNQTLTSSGSGVNKDTNNVYQQLRHVFLRDWGTVFAKDINKY